MKTRLFVRNAALALALALLPAVRAAVQASYYVDPVGGSDSNNGTSQATAFATLTRARDAVRTVNASMTGDIMVLLMPGDHLVTSTVSLTQADSGTNGHTVIWTCSGPRGSARLIGGAKVTGWTLDSGSVYKASVALGAPRLQAIFENGVRGHLARHPNTGYWSINAKDATLPKKKFQWKSTNTLPAIATPTNAQVFVWPGNRDWSTEIRDVASIDYGTRWITLTMNLQQPYLGALDAGSRFFVQGARELLDQPGEFHYDAGAGLLYYHPRNTPIANQEIIVPKVTTVFSAVPTGTKLLEARWRLDGSFEDSSTGGHDGAGENDPTFGAGPSGLGDALVLNGTNQYATVPDDAGLTFGAPTTAFTLSAWLKTTGTGLQPVICKARPETTGVDIDYRFGLEGGKLQLHRWNADNGGGAEVITDSNGASLNDGTWHHVAFVNAANNSHQLYVDGSLVETSSATWTYNDSNSEPVEIGRYANVQGGIFNYFAGSIDDVRIYRSALTATDIAAIHQQQDSDVALQNIAFVNLKFTGTNVDYTNFNGSGEGMIYAEGAVDFLVENNEFVNVGGTAVQFAGAGSGISVIGNHIRDAGVGGIVLRGVTTSLVSNNRVDHTGQVFANAGSSITLSDTTFSEVSYNLLSTCPRQGISLRTAANNTVKFNEVYGMDLDSQDTGAVKWGHSDWNTFDNNRIHDSGDSFGQQHGMYVEDGSDHNTITNNIIYGIGTSPSNTLTSPINVKGIANLIENNVFDFTKSHAALRTFEIASNGQARDEIVRRNIMYSTGSAVTLYRFQSYEDNRIAESDYNVFFKSAAGSYVMYNIPGSDTLSNWKTLQGGTYDQNSVTADPQFVDAANRNYTVQAGSPALGRGFVQIAQKTIGLKPDFILPDSRAQWIFSGDTTDITLNGNDGTKIGGSYVTDWAGAAASALSLNGTSDYVNVPDTDLLDFGAPSNAFSIVAWVKTTATSIGGIVSKARDTGTPNMDYRFRVLANGTVELTRLNQATGAVDAVTSTTAVNNGAWHHVAFVNEGASSHKIYIDGALGATSTTTWTHDNTNAEPVRIGRDRNATNEFFFNGQIDDVAIIRRALTANEIKDLNHIPHP